MASWELSESEVKLITSLRAAMRESDNGKFTVFWQGSMKRRIVDVEPAPRMRIASVSLRTAVDD